MNCLSSCPPGSRTLACPRLQTKVHPLHPEVNPPSSHFQAGEPFSPTEWRVVEAGPALGALSLWTVPAGEGVVSPSHRPESSSIETNHLTDWLLMRPRLPARCLISMLSGSG